MKKITYQTAFNKVWKYFVVEKYPASIQERSYSSAMCMYNGPNNTSCAFGILIPKNLRSLLKEGQNSDSQFKIKKNQRIICNTIWL